MYPTNRIATHPGEVLLEDFLKPMGVTQVAFAAHLGIPIQRVNEIVMGKRGVTAETALLFAQALGTTPDLWLSLQAKHELTKALARGGRKVRRLALRKRARAAIVREEA